MTSDVSVGLLTDDIRTLVPHRYPFLLVDRIERVELDHAHGAFIHGVKNVSINEPFFQGHFPEKPIMPGVLTLEALAQVAGILGIQILGDKATEKTFYYFAGADNVRFKRPVVPGDQLKLKATFLSKKCGLWKFSCQALVNDEIVCSGDVSCAQREL